MVNAKMRRLAVDEVLDPVASQVSEPA